MAVVQCQLFQLTDRYRGQAPSHIFDLCSPEKHRFTEPQQIRYKILRRLPINRPSARI